MRLRALHQGQNMGRDFRIDEVAATMQFRIDHMCGVVSPSIMVVDSLLTVYITPAAVTQHGLLYGEESASLWVQWMQHTAARQIRSFVCADPTLTITLTSPVRTSTGGSGGTTAGEDSPVVAEGGVAAAAVGGVAVGGVGGVSGAAAAGGNVPPTAAPQVQGGSGRGRGRGKGRRSK